MEWGDKLDFLEELEESGLTPKALENRPVMHEWMKEYTTGFSILSSTRQYGMGPNPIQLSEILAYLKLYGAEDMEAFIENILLMDASFLSVKAQKAEREKRSKT